MKHKLIGPVRIFIMLISVMLPSSFQPVTAQTALPPDQEFPLNSYCHLGQACKDEDGNWYSSNVDEFRSNSQSDVKFTGGPDNYGYIWDDSGAYSWIDATSGTVTHIHDTLGEEGPVPLPFIFPFYDDQYSVVYITAAGYITFENQAVRGQSKLPNSSLPNTIIAPFWAPILSSSSVGSIYYKTVGTAPNRYFIVEWHSIRDIFGNVFTFEVLLYENGNIKFQYKTINLSGSGYFYMSAGIEDKTGLDGLASQNWVDYPISNGAIFFTRPAPTGRAFVQPLYQGKFAHPNETNDFIFTIKNSGQLGEDTYDLNIDSMWNINLYFADSVTPLIDNNGDSRIDTGAIGQGDEIEVLARIITPEFPTEYESRNIARIQVNSSLDSTKYREIVIEETIPPPFAQLYSTSDSNALTLNMNWVNLQKQVEVANPGNAKINPAVVETNGHNFFNAWSEYISEGDGRKGFIIRYALVDQFGHNIVTARDLSSLNSNPLVYTQDYSLSLAVTTGDKIGATWVRLLWNSSTNLYNENVLFAVLNANGNVIYGPVSLTNNNQWSESGTGNLIEFFSPSIASVNDYSFMISWDRYILNGLKEIYYTIRQSTGDSIIATRRLTTGVINSREYTNQSLLSLSSDRFFIFYKYEWSPDLETYYSTSKFQVLDGSGNLLHGESELGLEWEEVDSVQLTNGNIMIFYIHNYFGDYDIWCQILNGNTYENNGFCVPNPHPSATGELSNLSVARFNGDYAVVTWSDIDNLHLYSSNYNMFGYSSTRPYIFQTSPDGSRFNLSYSGFATTSNSWNPPTEVDGKISFNSAQFGAAPNGTAMIGINYSNEGLATSTNTKISLVLDDDLIYLGDNSAYVPTISGNIITWEIADLLFGESSAFTVFVTLPMDAQIGMRYPIVISYSSDGPEFEAANNTGNAEIMSSLQIFLPALTK